jgi:hypothetical protein
MPICRGVGAMEIVAMDMKVSGMYIARQLSFSGVTFRIEEIPLPPAFEHVYNRAALLVSQGHFYGHNDGGPSTGTPPIHFPGSLGQSQSYPLASSI